MHQISDETIQLAQEHAQEIAQYAKAAEDLGKRVGGSCGEFIEEQGVVSRQQIEAGKANLNKLQETRSTEAYIEVVTDHALATQAHVDATKAHLQRSQVYVQLMRWQLRQRRANLHDAAGAQADL